MRLHFVILASALVFSCSVDRPKQPDPRRVDAGQMAPVQPLTQKPPATRPTVKALEAPTDINVEDLPPVTAQPPAPFEAYVGDQACAKCHAEEHATWKRSTHGKAGGAPTTDRVQGAFNGEPLGFKDAVVRPVRRGQQYAFEVQEKGRLAARYTVDAVIGGGHIHGGGTQAYFTRLKDGRLAMLPFDYSVTSGVWFCQNQRTKNWGKIGSDTRLRECEYPPRRVMGVDKSANCQNCHGSQIELQFDEKQALYVTKWQSLAINCESCHGPGRAHAEGAQRGSPVEMTPLELLGKSGSVAICSGCHADKAPVAPGFLGGDSWLPFFSSLHVRAPSERRFSLTGVATKFTYQEGHLWSDCYQNGSMTCVDCHDPHSGAYRDVFGRPLVGRFADGQCTGCHPSKGEGSRHGGHHAAQVKCTDCHMTMRQHPGVGDAVAYKRADHAINIPKPPRTGPGYQEPEGACAGCHAAEGKAWLGAAWTDLFGTPKPARAGVDGLAEVEASLDRMQSAPGMQMMAGRRTVSATEILEVVRAVKTVNQPIVARALSALVLILPQTLAPSVPSDVGLRLGLWSRSPDLELRGMAIAVCLFLTPYEPSLSGKALRGLKETASSDQLIVRRHVVFNLLAILFSLGDSKKGAMTLARRALEEYGAVLSEDTNPVASVLSASYAGAKEPRQAMKWILKSLDSDRFKSVRYGLDGAGSRADLLSRLARLLGEAGSNRGSVDRYREALRLNPNLGPAREALCVSLIKGGRKVEAIECVDEYLGVNPSFTQGHFIKARLYEELGKIKEAIKSAVAGLKLDPSNQRARENLRRLQRRR